jgi:hypothetical protein
MYLGILNHDMVGFANTSTREMIDHLFLSYGSITAVDLEHNFENMCKVWDTQQPVQIIFRQIQDCVDYAEAGGSQLVQRSKSELLTPIFFQQATLWCLINRSWSNIPWHK